MLDAIDERDLRFRIFIDYLPAAVLIKDLEGRYLMANRCWHTWFNPGSVDIRGKTASDFLSQNRTHDVIAHEREVVAQRKPIEIEYEEHVPLGSDRRRSILSLKFPIFNPDGNIVAIGGISTDITERKQIEEHLRQGQKMESLGVLAGGIAHDFNNLLAVIMGYTQLAAELAPNGPQQGYLGEVLTASTRAKELVQQILSFSRRAEHTPRPVQLHVLVREVLTLLRASLPATIEIRQGGQQEADMVLMDPIQMHQVLMNLCANAQHAMQDTGGILEIHVNAVDVDDAWAARHPGLRPGPYVCVTVRDTGQGMTPDVLERIFEPFFTTKGPGAGTGMGLAVVHGIITRHHGAITAQSTPGEGTTVTMYLPRIAESTPPTAQTEASIPPGKERILFVEDEKMLADVGRLMLTQLGYEVTVSHDGVDALETFQAAPHRFDIVITDQTMPRMTGEALVRELRWMRSDIPIILSTGFSRAMNAERAQAMGIDAFCLKPLTLQELATTIRQVLAQRAIRSESAPQG